MLARISPCQHCPAIFLPSSRRFRSHRCKAPVIFSDNFKLEQILACARGDAGENFPMPTLPRNFFAVLAAIFICQSSHAAETNSPLTLFYTNAAVKWTEALPIGNGRLGAMIFGGVEREHLQLNEGTLWAGGPYDPSNTNALAALPEARKLVFDGKYDDAHKLISEK